MLKSGHIKIYDWDNTVESYLDHHEGCSYVDRKKQLWGEDVLVVLVYEISDKAKAEAGAYFGNGRYYELLLGVTACGKQFEATGSSTDTPLCLTKPMKKIRG